MFSSRLQFGLEENRISQMVARKRAAGAAILDLTTSNPTSAGFDYPVERIAEALGDARALRYEPSAFGLPQAREAVSAYYAGRGIDLPASRIVLTASTSEAYSYLFKLLCDPGDEVLVPRPSYPLFEFLAQLENVRVVQYPLFYDEGWQVDAYDLASRITAKTRAVVLVNPNNPTGSYLKKHELTELSRLCAEHELALISDEVFSDYAFADDPSRVSTVAVSGGPVLSFSLSGLSKIAGLPQLKLGWIACGGPAHLIDSALAHLELITDTYLSVGTPVQVAAGALLEAGGEVRGQIRARCERNHSRLLESAAGSDASVLQVEGGWYATLQVARTRSEEDRVLGLIEHHNVLVQPGFFFDFASEAYLVLSLLTPEPTFTAALPYLLERQVTA